MPKKRKRRKRHEDIPEINNPKIRFPVLEGDKLMKEVLNGGYKRDLNVHQNDSWDNNKMMQRLSRSLSRFETQDIKTQPQFNH